MSTKQAMFELFETLYATTHAMNAMQKKPRIYCNESLYANETHTIKMIGQNEGISQAELSDRMLRTKGATSVIVGNLVDRGLVKREREEGNQRRYLLTLTERGKEVNAAHDAYDEECARQASEDLGISEEKLREVSAILSKFLNYATAEYLDH